MMEFDKDALKDSIRRDIDNRINERMNSRTSHGPSGSYHGIIWGAVILGVGVFLLLDHMGVLSVGNLWRFWPILMIVGGVVNLLEPGKRPWGVFLIAAGGLFQLDTLGIIRFRWSEFWPLLIIAAGAMMIWNSMTARRLAGTVGAQSEMNATAIFGGVERRMTARDFRFARISAVFGGVELDFHDADMEGQEAILEINVVFGGVEIRVPDNWRVEARNQTVFGGFTDSTRGGVASAADPAAPNQKSLIITGSAVFGGIEIKN
jgi:predicted membrane protein